MLTLIHAPQSRSSSIVWLLEEIGTPYERRIVNIRRGDGSGASDPGNPHPHHKVPALLDDGELIFETCAIALYLTDRFPEAKLGPQVGEKMRGAYLTWLAYRTGVLEPAMMERRLGQQHIYGAMGWGAPDEVETVLNEHLEDKAYFLGDQFSAVDVILGGAINFMLMFKMLTETPVFRDYCARITARPAFKRALEQDAAK
jgi:glutathione S-transferase